MSSSSSVICPSTRALGVSSCIRLRERSTVVFPHPDEPIKAVTWFASIVIVTPCTAWKEP